MFVVVVVTVVLAHVDTIVGLLAEVGVDAFCSFGIVKFEISFGFKNESKSCVFTVVVGTLALFAEVDFSRSRPLLLELRDEPELDLDLSFSIDGDDVRELDDKDLLRFLSDFEPPELAFKAEVLELRE